MIDLLRARARLEKLRVLEETVQRAHPCQGRVGPKVVDLEHVVKQDSVEIFKRIDVLRLVPCQKLLA